MSGRMSRHRLRSTRVSGAASVLAITLLTAAGCGGSGDGNKSGDPPKGGPALVVWSQENQPDRVAATRENIAGFTRRTGIRVDLVAIGDDELEDRIAAADRAGRLPDVAQLPMSSAHAYARSGLLNTDAAQEVVNRLGEETFSARALSLLTSEGRVAAVPSDGWGQLLIYRKDLFDKAGIATPRTLDDVRRAARRLHRGRLAGIALATAPSGFTAETFEHIALATGCQLLDDTGRVTLTSPACRRAFAAYVDLARHSVRGEQDVDSTRDTYFAGRAAMVFWSPFLLDAMAGLRDDAIPSCPECRDDPAYLARNSGLIGALEDPQGRPAQYGTIATWGITAGADVARAERFVEYMMSEGYERWLALSPQGKFPVRVGDRASPDRFVEAWSKLPSGGDRKAPLGDFYSPRSIEAIGEGALSFQRWGFEQGRAALVGALLGSEPVAKAVAAAIAGDVDPAGAAQQAQAAVEKLDAATR